MLLGMPLRILIGMNYWINQPVSDTIGIKAAGFDLL